MRLVGVEERVDRASVVERMTRLPQAMRAKLLPNTLNAVAFTFRTEIVMSEARNADVQISVEK